MKNNDISYRSSRGRCAVEVAVGLMCAPDAVVEDVCSMPMRVRLLEISDESVVEIPSRSAMVRATLEDAVK